MSAEPRIPVLFEDDALVVVDKPAGLPSVPVPGRAGRSAWSELSVSHPGVIAVHRLDQETSGVLVFARDPAAERALVDAFRSRDVEKLYWAVVVGCPAPARGEIRHAIQDRGKHAQLDRRGQVALTRYRVLERFRDVSWVEARPETGRYNQIRLHFVALGHPLVGERKYARGKECPVKFRRVALHARSIGLESPAGGRALKLAAPMPNDLDALLRKLRDERGPRS